MSDFPHILDEFLGEKNADKIREKICDAESFQKFSEGIKILSSAKLERRSFFVSETFFKYAGTALGVLVATLGLLYSGIASTTANMAKLNIDLTEIYSKTETRLNKASQDLNIAEVAVAEAKRSSEREAVKLAAIENQNKSIGISNKRLVEDNTDLENEISQKSDELERLKVQVSDQKRDLAVLSQSYNLCHDGVRVIFDEVTRRRNESSAARPLETSSKLNATIFSMEVFLFGNGKLRYIAYGQREGDQSSSRRTASGFWRKSNTSLTMEFAFDNRVFQTLELKLDDVVRLSDGSAKSVPAVGWAVGLQVFKSIDCYR